MLHVAQVSFFLDPRGREPEQLLQDWPSLVDVAEAASAAGVRVTVIQACARRGQLTRNGVDYHFVTPDEVVPTIACSGEFAHLVGDLGAQVHHVHGLGFPEDVQALARLAPRTPIIVQDHADQPPRIWRRLFWRRAFSVLSGAAFCASAQAQPFMDAGLLQPQTTIYEIPESSSRFVPGDQEAARRMTGLHGSPCLLWVGHLNDNKDPLAVLDGVSEAVDQLPELQLWCCFVTAPLLGDVQDRIRGDSRLRGRVHLLGPVPHQKIQRLMQAADLFVLGSHREGSGYSVIEALACGLPPVVTDIPSFRSLTDQARVGRLWTCGDARSLRESLLSIASRLGPELRVLTRQQFDAELSFAAVGRKLKAAYEDLVARRLPRES
ncbi:MAG TPA: glycosyltransferase family 4 protein [Steroidobacter sp.]|uniref:glycosyltransferase family 4 protein n=1 Tax=Steroidobacter sp. TaxID=1978227 RepID=UPI002ED7EB8D